ncbi:MAG: hypothetical protein ISR98_02250 [Parcubacteria group bacterium]|nr:hypothetical protein [Parcubacteria group bacterium]
MRKATLCFLRDGDKMWQDDIHWLPLVLAGKRVEGEFHFADNGESFEKFNIREI